MTDPGQVLRKRLTFGLLAIVGFALAGALFLRMEDLATPRPMPSTTIIKTIVVPGETVTVVPNSSKKPVEPARVTVPATQAVPTETTTAVPPSATTTAPVSSQTAPASTSPTTPSPTTSSEPIAPTTPSETN